MSLQMRAEILRVIRSLFYFLRTLCHCLAVFDLQCCNFTFGVKMWNCELDLQWKICALSVKFWWLPGRILQSRENSSAEGLKRIVSKGEYGHNTVNGIVSWCPTMKNVLDKLFRLRCVHPNTGWTGIPDFFFCTKNGEIIGAQLFGWKCSNMDWWAWYTKVPMMLDSFCRVVKSSDEITTGWVVNSPSFSKIVVIFFTGIYWWVSWGFWEPWNAGILWRDDCPGMSRGDNNLVSTKLRRAVEMIFLVQGVGSD